MIDRRTFMAAGAAAATTPAFSATGDPVVATSGGPIRGTREGGLSVFREKADSPALQPVVRPADGIHHLPAEVGSLSQHHLLLRYPLGRDKQRAQALMTAHHIGQRLA